MFILVIEHLTLRFESLLFKLEVLDHKARERAGILALTFGSPAPVLLQLDSAAEVISISLLRCVNSNLSKQQCLQ